MYDFIITNEIQRLETVGHIRATLARAVEVDERMGGAD